MVALHSIKYCEASAAISAMASAGVGDMYCSCCTYRFKCERCTHMQMFSVFFFGITTMGAYHSVASIIGVILFCCCNSSSSVLSVLSLLQNANGIQVWSIDIKWFSILAQS